MEKTIYTLLNEVRILIFYAENAISCCKHGDFDGFLHWRQCSVSFIDGLRYAGYFDNGDYDVCNLYRENYRLYSLIKKKYYTKYKH